MRAIFFQEKLSCKLESDDHPEADCQSLKITQSMKIIRVWSEEPEVS